jgi:hypothetical protein
MPRADIEVEDTRRQSIVLIRDPSPRARQAIFSSGMLVRDIIPHSTTTTAREELHVLEMVSFHKRAHKALEVLVVDTQRVLQPLALHESTQGIQSTMPEGGV